MTNIDLAIRGMTCASCANRIERKLNKLDGVTATVNYATERASVQFPETLSPQDLVAVVEAAGFSATVPVSRVSVKSTADDEVAGAGVGSADFAESDSAESDSAGDGEAASLLQRVTISAALTLPVLLMAMIPALQLRNWQWLSLTLAAPVV